MRITGKQVNLLKKIFKYVLLIIVGFAIGISAALAAFYVSGGKLFETVLGSRPEENMPISADATSTELTAYAFRILESIKSGNYGALSKVIHPEYGVVFSPYATINLTSNLCFSAAQVESFASDKNRYMWGKYDGSGNPIELTPCEYFKAFVYNKDYLSASKIGVDTVVKSGNSLENIKEIFPDARFVDFYIPGADPDTGGLDWSSLRLVFEEYRGMLMLTVIIHSEWTV